MEFRLQPGFLLYDSVDKKTRLKPELHAPPPICPDQQSLDVPGADKYVSAY